MNISNAEAIAATSCYTCGARQGEPCVYLPPKAHTYIDTPYPRPYPPSMQAMVDRVGTPTKNVHPHRRHDAFDLRRGGPLPPRGKAAIRNELRVLEALASGRWDGGEPLAGLSWPAIERCNAAGWVDFGGYAIHITDAGRARLKEARWPTR